jgi:hypothetical protein
MLAVNPSVVPRGLAARVYKEAVKHFAVGELMPACLFESCSGAAHDPEVKVKGPKTKVQKVKVKVSTSGAAAADPEATDSDDLMVLDGDRGDADGDAPLAVALEGPPTPRLKPKKRSRGIAPSTTPVATVAMEGTMTPHLAPGLTSAPATPLAQPICPVPRTPPLVVRPPDVEALASPIHSPAVDVDPDVLERGSMSSASPSSYCSLPSSSSSTSSSSRESDDARADEPPRKRGRHMHVEALHCLGPNILLAA